MSAKFLGEAAFVFFHKKNIQYKNKLGKERVESFTADIFMGAFFLGLLFIFSVMLFWPLGYILKALAETFGMEEICLVIFLFSIVLAVFLSNAGAILERNFSESDVEFSDLCLRGKLVFFIVSFLSFGFMYRGGFGVVFYRMYGAVMMLWLMFYFGAALELW